MDSPTRNLEEEYVETVEALGIGTQSCQKTASSTNTETTKGSITPLDETVSVTRRGFVGAAHHSDGLAT
jgi:hypothetical protein